jgi:hypothetical protein
MPRFAAVLAALVLSAACGGGTQPVAAVKHSPSPVAGGLSSGLIAYVGSGGIGVLDPATGKAKIVAPLAPGEFRVGGPVWAPAPGLSHPVIYFTVHDDRQMESRSSGPGVQPYDWLFRVDPFAGTIDPIAASQDSTSEGPIGVVANSHYVALTVGCCATYEVDALDLTKPAGPLKVLSRPPDQTAFFTEGIGPGDSGLVAVRAFATGAWYWLNADAGVLHPFPLKLGPDDGPIAITPDGMMAAVALPSGGAVIEPINSGLPLATASASTSAGATTPATATAAGSPSPKATPIASATPRQVNPTLLHPDSLAWSPDASELALAINGEIQLYKAAAPGTAPAARYLTGSGVAGIAWSGALADRSLTDVVASPGPQTLVDGLLTATRLPAAADTPANRPLTQVYVWQFDSTRASAIATIADATPAVLAKYPPLDAGVVLHHWAPTGTWTLLGGCYRYRVVITGSIPPVATTVGLAGSTLCSAPKASPAASSSPRPT